MLFVIGINCCAFRGADVERVLRAHWDISEFEVYDANRDSRPFFGVPQAIRQHAEGIAHDTWQSCEAADFYLGLARGYDVKSAGPTPTSGQIRCICYDYAAIIDRFGKKVDSLCLNKAQVHERTQGSAELLHNDTETFETLIDILRLACHASVLTN